MPKLNSHAFKMTVIVLFLASCANGNKKNSTSSQKFNRSQSNTVQMNSPLNERQLIQELTGKRVSSLPTQEELRHKPLATQHYFAGMRAAESKNYILAIKHFNTVLKKYPRSAEVKSAFSAKAKVYKEMGLNEPANLNLRMAQNSNKAKPVNKKTASSGKSSTTR